MPSKSTRASAPSASHLSVVPLRPSAGVEPVDAERRRQLLSDLDYLADGAAAGGPTRTEVLVTTSLEGGSRYLARTADVYYIAHHDALLYLDPPPPPPVPLVPMKTWRMVTP